MCRSGVPCEEFTEEFGIPIDLSSHRRIIQGQNVNIGPTEYRLLELLMRHPDRVFKRDQLLDKIWGRSTYIEIRTVDVNILRLRKVLKPFGLDGTIQTVRSVGTDSRQSLNDSLAVSPDIASERNASREQAASQIFLMF